MNKHVTWLLLAVSLFTAAVRADEGFWRPSQMTQVGTRLQAQGLALDPRQLADLTQGPLGATLQGLSGAFVSPDGLIVTCHHCIADDYAQGGRTFPDQFPVGFYAKTRAAERPPIAQHSIFVTEDVRDVTHLMAKNIGVTMNETQRRAQSDANRNTLLRECERAPGRHCRLLSDFEGARYWLQRLFEIKDVRLVYVPASRLANFGAEHMADGKTPWWPAYRADFAFLRAYVAPDGTAAPYAAKNVPYHPKRWLKISNSGVREGDFICAAGLPMGTRRTAIVAEVDFEYSVLADARVADWHAYAAQLARALGHSATLTQRYSYIADMANAWPQHFTTMKQAAARTQLVDHKRMEEKAFRAWAAANADRHEYAQALDTLERLMPAENASRLAHLGFEALDRVEMVHAARTLYTWVRERANPDDDRAPGFQDRDRSGVVKSLADPSNYFEAAVDRQLLQDVLERFRSHDLKGSAVLEKIDTIGPERAYALTHLSNQRARLAWLDADRKAVEISQDPFMQIAVALHTDEQRLAQQNESRRTVLEAARKSYVTGLVQFAADEGRALYPEADGTLRVNFGKVLGEKSDPAAAQPLSFSSGMLKTYTGKGDFNLPPALVSALRAGQSSRDEQRATGLPVNFQGTEDSHLGNSGSVVLNSHGNLVGIVWGQNENARVSAWRYDPDAHRTYQTDIRFVMWMLDKVDHAQRLIAELDLTDDRIIK